jgi:predicted Zn-dependent protease with MMP-like domain
VVIRRRGVQARGHPDRRTDLTEEQSALLFEDLVAQALDSLPPDAQRLLENVAVVIEDEPTPDQLERSGLRPHHTLYGLYEGVSGINYGADWATVPNKITIFRLPLEEDYPNPDRLAREVQRTVLHEIGHHAGLGHARLRQTRVG